MQYTVENICGFLIRSRLLNPEEVKTMYARWVVDAKDDPRNLAAFMKWLVGRHYVTEYQAALLARGRADDFFLNQYRILDRLGRGRMAGVYKAVHQLGQTVAIKVLPPSRSKNPQFLGRFQREASLAMRLKHPNVVRSFQLGEARGLHYLVMEYLEGITLEDVLQRRKKLPPGEAVRLIHQALMGLQHIFELGMVHRDMKPANLMLVPLPAPGEGDTTLHATVKVLDIGLGRAFEEQPDLPQHAELTGEGVLLGTPDYLAPEQARDPRSSDIRADIYSLGCVLYHCLTGQPPFPDTNLLNQMVRHATETARPLADFNPTIPDGLQQIINWMIAKQPAQRYPTPERAAQALQIFLVAEAATPSASEPEPPQLRKFLTWLEMDGNGRSAGQPAQGPSSADKGRRERQAPAATSSNADTQLVPPNPPQQAARRGKLTPVPPTRSAGSGARPKQAPAAVAQPAAPPPAAAIDVELVPATAEPNLPNANLARLTRRDWILLGLGAGAVIIFAMIGTILAWVLR
jgi:serine/threonine protein kinase